MTAIADRLADPAEFEDTPVLSTRIIPNSEPNKRPSVAELVRLDVPATLHVAQDGTHKLWAGRGSLTMNTVSTVEPLAPAGTEEGPRVLRRRLRLRPPARPRDSRLPRG